MRAIPTRLCCLPVALAFFLIATFISTLIATFIATPALATDGVLEINQACAVTTGCFAGDTAAYPVTITGSAGRSYRLTSDLVVPDENTDAIRVSTSRITLDLNGFEITRSACVGASANCTPVAGSGSGVEMPVSTDRGVSVKNGSIIGMGGYGVTLGEESEVTNLRVLWNALSGITADSRSTISGNTAHENGSIGIVAGQASIVRGNVASGNGSLGIQTLSAVTASGNVAYNNGSSGISGGSGMTVSGNTAYNNSGIGISVGSGGTVSGNTTYNNMDDGIVAGAGSAVQHNTVGTNGDHGLSLAATSTYSENLITGNSVGGVFQGVNKGTNYCSGPGVVLATCP